MLKKPSADQVNSLVKKLTRHKAEQDSINGTARELIAKAVETQHFDKVALSWVRKAYKMAKDRPEAWAVTLPHFLAYLDDLQLAQIADDHAGLPLENTIPEINADDVGSETGGDFDETPASGRSPSLTIVPRPDEERLEQVGRGVA